LIVADTGAIIALLDADDQHHFVVRQLFLDTGSQWLLPWAILPEVDYLLHRLVGEKSQRAFMEDLATGSFLVEWGQELDLVRARALCEKHRSLRIGLVDACVIAVAERVKAQAIATLDLRHFGAIKISGKPRLLPRDSA
jgi:uncharacterized protein